MTQQTQQRDRNEPFGWILVDKTEPIKLGKVSYAGAAYTLGTWSECAAYQLKHGLRVTTKIVAF